LKKKSSKNFFKKFRKFGPWFVPVLAMAKLSAVVNYKLWVKTAAERCLRLYLLLSMLWDYLTGRRVP